MTRTRPALVTAVLLLAALPARAAPPPAEEVAREVLAGLGDREDARRLAALERLAALLPGEGRLGARALPRLRAILRLRGPRERAAVCGLLPRIPDAEARALWLERLDLAVETHEDVLAAAVDGARTVAGDRDLARALLQAAADPRADVARRALLLETLGWMEGPAPDLLLATGRPGEHWVEACGRARGLAHRPRDKAVPALLDLLEHEEPAPRLHAWESLVDLTRQDLPLDAKAWRAWWAKARPRQAAAPAPAAAGERYAAPRPVHVPHYYGIPIPRPASRVVFCLDVSQSMYGGGIDQARRELRRTLMDLPSQHTFEIVLFNENVLPWAGRLVRAHPVQKYRAIEHLMQVEPTSYTNLYGALEEAFGHAGRGRRAVAEPVVLDAIFLLSDGAPNRGLYRSDEQVLKHVARLSRREIPVNTIGAGEEVFPLLQAIARETGGVFVDAFE